MNKPWHLLDSNTSISYSARRLLLFFNNFYDFTIPTMYCRLEMPWFLNWTIPMWANAKRECFSLFLFSNNNCFIFYSQIGNDNESEHIYGHKHVNCSGNSSKLYSIDKGQNDNQMRKNVLVFRSISPLSDENKIKYPHPNSYKLYYARVYHWSHQELYQLWVFRRNFIWLYLRYFFLFEMKKFLCHLTRQVDIVDKRMIATTTFRRAKKK